MRRVVTIRTEVSDASYCRQAFGAQLILHCRRCDGINEDRTGGKTCVFRQPKSY
jgi:hypothetical protein